MLVSSVIVFFQRIIDCGGAVLNHKAAADFKEKCYAQEVDPNDRNKPVSEPYEISAWLGFNFPGRKDQYSKLKYHWYHFSGTDFNAQNNKTAIYKILGDETKGWAEGGDVDSMGNSCSSLEMSH